MAKGVMMVTSALIATVQMARKAMIANQRVIQTG